MGKSVRDYPVHPACFHQYANNLKQAGYTGSIHTLDAAESTGYDLSMSVAMSFTR